MVYDGVIDAELHLLGVHHHELQLGRMFLVEQAGDDGVQSDGLTLARGTGHEQVGHLGQIDHEDLVGDGLAQGHRQLVIRLLELAAVQYALHRHHLGLGVWYLDTDGSLAGNGCDDTDAQCREREGDVILEVPDLGDADARGWGDFIEGDGGADCSLDAAYLHTEVREHLYDAVFVLRLLLHVDIVALVLVLLQEVQGRVLVELQVQLRVVGFQGTLVVEYGFLGVFAQNHLHALFLGGFLFLLNLYGWLQFLNPWFWQVGIVHATYLEVDCGGGVDGLVLEGGYRFAFQRVDGIILKACISIAGGGFSYIGSAFLSTFLLLHAL